MGACWLPSQNPMSMPELGSEGPTAIQDTASILSRPSLEVPTTGVPKTTIPPEVLRMLPSDFVKQHLVLPLQIRDGTLDVATSKVGNQRVIDDIRLLTGLEVEEVLMPATEILEKIAEGYQVTVEKMIESLNPEQATAVEGRNLHDIEVMANE